MELKAEQVLELFVDVGPEMVIGMTMKGYLRVIPIVGGSFSGKGIKGTVIPGGADWNTMLENNTSHVFAKYIIKTDDDVFISVENEGYIDFSKESVIKTNPRFQVRKDSKYAWLNDGVFVGSLEPVAERPAVYIRVYKLD